MESNALEFSLVSESRKGINSVNFLDLFILVLLYEFLDVNVASTNTYHDFVSLLDLDMDLSVTKKINTF